VAASALPVFGPPLFGAAAFGAAFGVEAFELDFTVGVLGAGGFAVRVRLSASGLALDTGFAVGRFLVFPVEVLVTPTALAFAWFSSAARVCVARVAPVVISIISLLFATSVPGVPALSLPLPFASMSMIPLSP
jgi:hypothetical protein